TEKWVRPRGKSPAKEARRTLERLYRLVGVLAASDVRHEDLGVRKIGRHLHYSDGNRTYARVFHLGAQESREIALDLVADSACPLGCVFHCRYCATAAPLQSS